MFNNILVNIEYCTQAYKIQICWPLEWDVVFSPLVHVRYFISPSLSDNLTMRRDAARQERALASLRCSTRTLVPRLPFTKSACVCAEGAVAHEVVSHGEYRTGIMSSAREGHQVRGMLMCVTSPKSSKYTKLLGRAGSDKYISVSTYWYL